MNTLLSNQIGKEVREHRFVLCAWWGLLLLELIHGLGSTSNIFGDAGEIRYRGGFWAIYELGLVGLAVVLPLAIGLADSPSNPSGFIQTRPVSAGTVWGGKLAVLCILVALPGVMVPFLICLVHGPGLGHAFQAALDWLAFTAPVLIFFLCWGGLCSGPAQLARLTVVVATTAAGAFFASIGVGMLLNEESVNRIFEEPGSLACRILVLLIAAAAIAAWALLLQVRGPRSPRRPALVICAIALCIAFVSSLPGLNWLESEVALSDEDAAALAQTGIRVDPYSLKVWQSGTRAPRVQLQAAFQFDGAPRGMVFVSHIQRATLSGDGGFETVYRSPGNWSRRMGFNPPEEVLAAMADTFDRDITIFQGASGGYAYHGLGSSYVSWDAKEVMNQLDQPLDLEYEIGADCMRIRQVARIPFEHGKTADGDGTTFTVLRPNTRVAGAGNFGIRLRLPRAILTSDSELRTTPGYSLRHRYLCLLVHPERRQALVCFSESAYSVRAGFSGCPEFFLICRFETGSNVNDSGMNADLSTDVTAADEDRRPFGRSFFEGASVHLFRYELAGEMSATTRVNGLRLDHRMTEMTGSTDRGRLDLSAYQRALERLGEIEDQPDPRTMRALLSVIERAKHLDFDADPGVRVLTRVANAGLGPVMDALGASRYRSQAALLTVIERSALDSDRARVIASLESAPDLAQVLVNRGWEADARDEILAILRARRLMPLRAAALLRDPETYPYLLEQFDRRFDVATYELLWELPALRPELERRIAARWDQFSRVTKGNPARASELKLALRIGRADALEMVLSGPRDEDYNTIQALRPVMLLPRDYREAQAALARLSADEFSFHAKRRVFLPRADANAGANAEDPS